MAAASPPPPNSQTCIVVAPFAPPGSPPRALSSATASTPTLKPPASSSVADAELCSLADKTTYAPSFPGPPIIIADARSELHLLNLITGDQISLLSVNPILKDDAGNNVTAYNVFFYDTNIPRK
uniref:Uncharacterized protein n=1 Tax=Oryza rufipogon TaxID=4529 RepID=A0A0E0RDU5_ORYRU